MTEMVSFFPTLNYDYNTPVDEEWRVVNGDHVYMVEFDSNYAQAMELRTLDRKIAYRALFKARSVDVRSGALIATNGNGVQTLILAAGTWQSICAVEGISLFNPDTFND